MALQCGIDRFSGYRFPPGPAEVTAVEHDDKTNPNHPRHNTVSHGDGSCRFETKPDGTTIQPPDWGLRYYLSIYFVARLGGVRASQPRSDDGPPAELGPFATARRSAHPRP